MRKIYLLMLAVLAICIAACGSKNSKGTTEGNDVITVVTKISGPLGEYFEAVPKDYKVNDKGAVFIEIKRIKDGFPEPWKKGMKLGLDGDEQFDFDLIPEFRDENGTIIRKGNDTDVAGSDLIEIADLSVNESASIELYVKEGENQIKFSSIFEVTDESFSSSSDDDEVSSIDDSESEDWDSILDSYERMVEKYVSLAKKVKGGDSNAMSEYMELAEEAQELYTKLSNAKNNLSSAQMSRYMKIAQKMANAAQQM